ncbi:unnamed protein product [Somion occarium]|uniref:Uncharacterized protein n=1 Tax=Somion occarium TaxID=3059160 RepID=A0ABP1DK95_9APHY
MVGKHPRPRIVPLLQANRKFQGEFSPDTFSSIFGRICIMLYPAAYDTSWAPLLSTILTLYSCALTAALCLRQTLLSTALGFLANV